MAIKNRTTTTKKNKAPVFLWETESLCRWWRKCGVKKQGLRWRSSKDKDRREKKGRGAEPGGPGQEFSLVCILTGKGGCSRWYEGLKKNRDRHSLLVGFSGSGGGVYIPEPVATFDSWFRTSLEQSEGQGTRGPWFQVKQAGGGGVAPVLVAGRPRRPRGGSLTRHDSGPRRGPRNVCWMSEQQKPRRSMPFCTFSVRCTNCL